MIEGKFRISHTYQVTPGGVDAVVQSFKEYVESKIHEMSGLYIAVGKESVFDFYPIGHDAYRLKVSRVNAFDRGGSEYLLLADFEVKKL